jgi:hypothetical protein
VVRRATWGDSARCAADSCADSLVVVEQQQVVTKSGRVLYT